MENRDKLHKNYHFLTPPLRVALFTAGILLLYQPVMTMAASSSTIEAGSGAVAETKAASAYGTALVVSEEDTETAANNWIQEDGNWYYVLPDGSRNHQDLQYNNALYKFNWNGTLKSAQWIPNTGGGAYPVFCYDVEAQAMFDQMNEEKRDLYFDEYPDREEDYANDAKIQYDRYAGFLMDERLNQAAQHRLEKAAEQGYFDGSIPGEGTLEDYLEQISYRKNSICRELYIQGREDAEDAFDRLLVKTQDKYDSNGKRKDSLEYYRRAGVAHTERGGKQYFMIILMR